MTALFTRKAYICKYLILAALMLGGCTVNPATGQQQFTGLLSASQEASIGASEHDNIRKTYGEFVTGPIADYVNRIGQKVAANTERADVQYKFYVIDSPIVNAFALPGGYIYLSRGLIALANNEAELAGVIAHEIGHVTGRHAAARMSQGALVGIGAAILSAATGSDAVGQVANVGSDLYIKSYSRGQEHEADDLGVRYLARAGYDPRAMASFLASLDAQTKLDRRIAGQSEGEGMNYLSTHPVTADRVAQATAMAGRETPGANVLNRDVYLSTINGLTYGDSEKHGFTRGDHFYHPGMGFTFNVPKGFTLVNSTNEVVATHPSGSLVILDSGRDDMKRDPLTYLTQVWMKTAPPQGAAERITVNGMRAATAAFAGAANNKPVIVRVVVIEWKPGQFFRFQMAMPESAGADVTEGMKRATYSFRAMTPEERNSIRPLRLQTVKAGPGDTLQALSSRMAFPSYREDRFRVLNAIGGQVKPGEVYKVVVE